MRSTGQLGAVRSRSIRAGSFRHGRRPGVRAALEPVSYARQPEHYRITVKREDRGAASAALHQTVRKGSMLELRPPAGQFRLDRSGVMPLVLVAAGIGVTPLLAMAQAHLDRGVRAPPLRFLHCVRNGSSHPLREELEALVHQSAACRARFFYSQPTAADRESQRFHEEGRLTAERLIAALEDLQIEFAGKTIPVPWYEVDLYLCGPPSFLQQITADLLTRGARAERLRTERFSPTPTAPPKSRPARKCLRHA